MLLFPNVGWDVCTDRASNVIPLFIIYKYINKHQHINLGKSTMKAFILRVKLHFGFSTQKMEKWVSIRYIKDQIDPFC